MGGLELEIEIGGGGGGVGGLAIILTWKRYYDVLLLTVKGIATNLTNPYFTLAMFRACFFRYAIRCNKLFSTCYSWLAAKFKIPSFFR